MHSPSIPNRFECGVALHWMIIIFPIETGYFGLCWAIMDCFGLLWIILGHYGLFWAALDHKFPH